MARLRQWIFALLFAASLGGSVLATVPTPVSAAPACPRFLTFPAWHCGIVKADGTMAIKDPKTVALRLAANIIEILMQLVGYVSLGFIIYGGFLYMIATGDSGKLAGAKSSILNAVIGLIIAIFSVAIINFLTERFI